MPDLPDSRNRAREPDEVKVALAQIRVCAYMHASLSLSLSLHVDIHVYRYLSQRFNGGKHLFRAIDSDKSGMISRDKVRFFIFIDGSIRQRI